MRSKNRALKNHMRTSTVLPKSGHPCIIFKSAIFRPNPLKYTAILVRFLRFRRNLIKLEVLLREVGQEMWVLKMMYWRPLFLAKVSRPKTWSTNCGVNTIEKTKRGHLKKILTRIWTRNLLTESRTHSPWDCPSITWWYFLQTQHDDLTVSKKWEIEIEWDRNC